MEWQYYKAGKACINGSMGTSTNEIGPKKERLIEFKGWILDQLLSSLVL